MPHFIGTAGDFQKERAIKRRERAMLLAKETLAPQTSTTTAEANGA